MRIMGRFARLGRTTAAGQRWYSHWNTAVACARGSRDEGGDLSQCSTDAGGPWSTVTGPGNHQGDTNDSTPKIGRGFMPAAAACLPWHNLRESRKELLGLVFEQTPRLRCSSRYN